MRIKLLLTLDCQVAVVWSTDDGPDALSKLVVASFPSVFAGGSISGVCAAGWPGTSASGMALALPHFECSTSRQESEIFSSGIGSVGLRGLSACHLAVTSPVSAYEVGVTNKPLSKETKKTHQIRLPWLALKVS